MPAALILLNYNWTFLLCLSFPRRLFFRVLPASSILCDAHAHSIPAYHRIGSLRMGSRANSTGNESSSERIAAILSLRQVLCFRSRV